MDVTSSELIRRWRKRRVEILRHLPTELLAEFRKLGKLIGEVRRTVAESNKPSTPPVRMGFLGPLPPPRRRSLTIHRTTLVKYLTERGPSTRLDIAADTGIPAGSLSKLLMEAKFESVERGLWALKGQAKKPGPSAPPAK